MMGKKSILNVFKENWILITSVVFVMVNVLLIGTERDSINFLPVFLMFLLLYILFPIKFFLVYLAFSPLSISLSEFYPNLPFDMWLPSELMLVALSPISLYLMLSGSGLNRWFAWNPITLTIYFFLGWLTVTTITSTIPVVSVKYLVLKALYFMVLLYLPYILFTGGTTPFRKTIYYYMMGMLGVILITLVKQWQNGLFDKQVAHGSCNPFFIDHTSYAAALALLIPVSIALFWSAKSVKTKIFNGLLSLIFLLALILSYTRAAWLSLIVAGSIWIVWLLKVRFRYVFIISTILLGTLYHFQDDILIWLNQNKTASSADFRKHISSIANIRTDESNVERLNRWTSAIRMFEEKPIFGWGPGTYMFQYAPFQASYLKTRESSNLGLKGNAHSEYLGLLSEAGVPALLAFLVIIALLLYKGFRLAFRLKPNGADRTLLVGAIFGLITYLVHGFLNNFLDMDKIAVLFWGYAAFILSIDYSYSKSNPSIDMSSNTSASDSLS